MEIIVLQGPPACGKSSWAKEFVKGKKDWVIVCRDSIRDSRGDYWVPDQETYISDIEEYSVRQAIKRNLNVIIDATNLNPKTIKKWEDLSDELGVQLTFKEFYVPYNIAWGRDRNADRKHPVGTRVLQQFYKRYYPERYEQEKDLPKGYYIDPRIKDVDYFAFSSKPWAIICDLDGTLALHDNRSPYDYDQCITDVLDPRVARLLRCDSSVIFYVTGREDTGNVRGLTTKWLLNHDMWFDNSFLLMRKKNDYRSTDVLKQEIYREQIKPFYNVIYCIEDSNRVTEMWRKEGLLCLQVDNTAR